MSRPPLVDTHSHLQDPLFDDDRDEVITRAEVAGLRAIVCVGYDPESSRRAVDLAAQYACLYAAVGIHPNYAARAAEADWEEVRELVQRPKVVAVGETGLDNYRAYTPPDIQEIWFQRHLELAAERRLPVVVHNRQADDRVRGLLSHWAAGLNWGRPVGVLHCFSSDGAMLEAGLEAGFVISLAGVVTFKNATALREVAKAVPAGRLVVETDCPYLAPHPHRGQRNEPLYVTYTARELAELRGESEAVLGAHTTRTAADLLGLAILTIEGVETA